MYIELYTENAPFNFFTPAQKQYILLTDRVREVRG